MADLNSTNGTFVNDDVIREQKLRDGDQVRIGRSILKFMTGENVEVHYHEEIYRLMTVDGLTQIYNRRYFNEALEREFNRSKRYDRQLSLVVFDIDHFKRVNDTHGHLAEDQPVARQIANGGAPRGCCKEDIFAAYRRRGVRHPGSGGAARRREDDGGEGAAHRGEHAAEGGPAGGAGDDQPGLRDALRPRTRRRTICTRGRTRSSTKAKQGGRNRVAG